MLVRAILQTSLVLWLVQSTIQGGVRPQTGALGRLASRGPGIGVKSGGPVAGILGVRGYGAGKPGKTGSGRYLGGAAYRPTAIRGGLKQGYGTLGGYGGASNLGTGLGAAGLGLGTGYGLGNGLGAALGYPAGKLGGRGYTSNGYGAQLGYGAGGYPGAGRGYGLGAAGYLGAGYTDGYGAGLGAGGYPQGVRAGKQIAGYSNGYGSEVYGTADGYGAGPAYPSVLADNVGLNGIAGLGAAGLGGPGLVVNPGLGADAKSRKYGAGGVLGAAGSLPYGGQPVVSAGLGPQGKTGSYGGATYGGIPSLGADTSLGGTGGAMEPLAGGAVGQIPYSAPVIAAGLDVDAGYPFGAEQVSLGADATKTAAKYGTGYAAALSTGGQGPYGGQKDGSKLSGMYGNGYKG
ncbi:glycine-rich cell wall structural protein 1.0 isoform X6 [Cyprinus carpio]|uniref:Glycine-rich cell wall structural protein 1.0 isoform X6 n=1 Tax=Cyprinus carpio TaxID=7962 RepID=A0A9Q9XZA6_CYPCA|nr:glycine-rich cell wall structural protein 1.0 isoform X6 [Cyprinus carpio]